MVSIMNKLVCIAILLAISMSAHASESGTDPDPVGRWLHQRALQMAMRDKDSTMGRLSAGVGSYRIVRLADLDAPEEVKHQFRADIARSEGVVRVAEGSIPTQAQMLAALPRRQRSASELRQRLPQPPSRLEGSLLGPAEMIGMEPSGALDGEKSSGLTRFYRLQGAGIVEFSENNFLAAGTHIEAIAEAQNTTVNGVPAQLRKRADGVGHTRVELAWTGRSKTYSLVATGEKGSDVERNARLLHDIAAAIVD
ncbi:hypothetical protein D7U89_17520 [Stenotrophomonas maltophilia]|nr:hypothetical protein [Stenotrophomonas maltophilia]MBA0368246.1 hypothetical protein [Stenotrophomonas maltophilia]MBA0405478.1 hypothetical protein [Stenotrophomonas maltophilia]PSD12749.1 hypothetical protein C7E14_16330 [Stenotrophomonas maltophilia]PSD31424.1 hypothetical protein C7E12_03925 [Stenotrophomonas maltophilia]